MKQISSADFRVNYTKLTEPHEVTANGRVIMLVYPVLPTAPELPEDWLKFRPVPKPGSTKKRKPTTND